MEISVSPKGQFMRQEQLASEFRATVIKESVQTAVTYAVAEMNFNGQFNSEQMKAVRDFVDTFLNLGERPPEVRTRPDKSLKAPETLNKRNRPRTENI